MIQGGLHDTAVQIGLGIGGGSHFALRQIFDRVVTIDVDPINIARFKSFVELDPQRDIILQGNSTDPAVIEKVRDIAFGCDLLFIDGGHRFEEVSSDWSNYKAIVRPGGLICFYDSVPRPSRYHELQIDISLTWLEHQPFAPPAIRTYRQHPGYRILCRRFRAKLEAVDSLRLEVDAAGCRASSKAY